MSKDTLLSLLSKDAYQVELGPGGRGITELKKEEIESLNLSGIDFIEDQKRYYPNGDFASYIIGYAKKQDDGSIVGELGIESKYEDILKGTDGSTKYQRDRYGYKIPDTPETTIEPENGSNIYLTIDSGIQRFLEDAVKANTEDYNPEWTILTVMDAKSGKILGSATSPSYNPNLLNMKSYENPLVTYAYEPGSTMKIYTYMCAMEKGTYKGDDTYLSGKYEIGENTVQDWNGKGWGYITYDLGFEYSSNVAVVNLVNNAINRADLKECFQKYGFGEKTGIELSRELSGSLNFYYPIEVATASFGQGIATTPIQNLQALSIIANNGKMVKPKIIEKIVNSSTGKMEYEYKLDISEQLVQESTVAKIKELMSNVINGQNEGTTGYYFKVEGADLIGKTGTSQYYDSESGYSTGKNNYVYSFAGMFPKDNPEIIIYAAYKNPTWSKNVGLSKMIKSVVKDIAKYHDVGTYNEHHNTATKYTIESFINKDVKEIKEKLNSYNIKTIVIGNGDKIIKQSAKVGSSAVSGDTIIVITNDSAYTMPNITGWSRKEIIEFCNILGIGYEFEGYGYASSQSIEVGSKINESDILKVSLKNKVDS